MRKYIYRSLPCSVRSDDTLWAVSGLDKVNNGAGILEWCLSREDAEDMAQYMNETGEFSGLRAHKYN